MESDNKNIGTHVLGEYQAGEAHVQLGVPRRFHRGMALELGLERWDD